MAVMWAVHQAFAVSLDVLALARRRALRRLSRRGDRPVHGRLEVALGSGAPDPARRTAAFAARFSNLVGKPPLAYLTGWRMTLAADLLRDSDMTVATVARQIGYADPFAFKRHRGVSPSIWRTAAVEPPLDSARR